LHKAGNSLTKDIFEFWAEMAEDAHVHPADEQVFTRLGNSHGFSLDCRPGAYCGPLKTAKVVLLFLSPGLDPKDKVHGASPDGKKYYAEQRTGVANLPDVTQHEAAQKWLSYAIKQFGLGYEEARSVVATLNIGAYKSTSFPDWHMLAALPSSRVCLDWAQSTLFPQAERGEKVVVCLRSHNYWGLGVGEPIGKLFRPECNRNARMLLGEMRTRIEEAVRAAVRETAPHAKLSN
jgi:hypothetical protein